MSLLWRVQHGVIAAGFSVLAFLPTPLFAYMSSSPNFRLDEGAIGGGGLNQSSSANYKASNSTNDLAVGSAASENFQVEAGSQTTPDPTLSFTIESTDINFGKFSPGTAAMTTSKFSVTNYTSYGYVVQVVGDPPTNGDHAISPLAEQTDSQPGIEQFGINLVANTMPDSIGANPKNTEHGVGKAAPNYDEANKFRYASGETIAMAPKSSGKTSYTISYLVNVASLTPGGTYTSDQTLIVTGTY